MGSQVDVCNAALVKLAQDIAISAISESTKAARTFNRTWDRVRDLVLAEHVWPFALKAAPLEEMTETAFPGWAKRYAYPADCITAVAVCDASGVRAGLTAVASCRDDSWRSIPFTGRAEFEVTYGDQSQAIATDLSTAWLIYVVRVEDVARWPVLFAETVACRLAYETAPAIQGELGLRAQSTLLQNYEMARAKAIAHELNESRDMLQPMTPSLAVRS